MEIKDLIKIIKEVKEKDEIKLEERKRNISSDYIMAKLDFTIIDNFADSVETLRVIINELEELQERIIKRNKGE